jgi:hypothetical protein
MIRSLNRSSSPVKTVSLRTGPAETRVCFNTRGKSIYAPVRINNILTINFVLDSGAISVIVPSDVYLTLVRARVRSKKPIFLVKGTT